MASREDFEVGASRMAEELRPSRGENVNLRALAAQVIAELAAEGWPQP
jgi:hypothetical protein